MSLALNSLLTLLLNYGYPVIVLVVIGGYFGLPVPADAILLAAGALSYDGSLHLSIVLVLVTVTAVIGDVVGYYIGKRFGHLVVNKFTEKIGITHNRIDAMDRFLKKWGGWCVFFTRWLITPLDVPVNIAAGLAQYPFKRFLILAVIGEAIWSLLFSGIGYIFGANWPTLITYVNGAPQLLALFVLGLGTLLLAYRLHKRLH